MFLFVSSVQMQNLQEFNQHSLNRTELHFNAVFNHVKSNAHLAITLNAQGRLILYIVDVC